MERSVDFRIVNHILTKHGFNEIGKNKSNITYFQNNEGVKTSLIDREDNFSKKYLIELCDQVKIDSAQFIDSFTVIKEMIINKNSD